MDNNDNNAANDNVRENRQDDQAHDQNQHQHNHNHNPHFYQEQEQRPRLIPENRRLLDLDSWIELNGLRSRDDILRDSSYSNNNNDDGPSDADIQRWMECEKYQAMIHEKIFSSFDEEEKQKNDQRQNFIHSWPDDAKIQIIVKNNTKKKQLYEKQECRHQEEKENQEDKHEKDDDDTMIMVDSVNNDIEGNDSNNCYLLVPVKPLAECCETIYALLRYVQNLVESHRKKNTGNATDRVTATTSSSSSNTGASTPGSALTFSLESYPIDAVHEFLNVVVRKTKTVYDIPEQSIVDCCRIGHYLQHESMVHEIHTNILVHSIDTSNCLFLCQIADLLNLYELFERALKHMMHTLGDINTTTTNASNNHDDIGDPDDCNDDDFMTAELRTRIESIQTALKSSIQRSNQNATNIGIYVSSIQEYIAIFAERVQYYKERLEDAKDQFERLQAERNKYTKSKTCSSSLYLRDVQQKIQKQEVRVQTLQAVLNEQKKMFLNRL